MVLMSNGFQSERAICGFFISKKEGKKQKKEIDSRDHDLHNHIPIKISSVFVVLVLGLLLDAVVGLEIYEFDGLVC